MPRIIVGSDIRATPPSRRMSAGTRSSAITAAAPAALLMRAFERLPAEDSLLVARVTYELLRPAPLGELDVEARVARPGRRVRLLEGAIRTAEGTEVVRARALQVRPADAAGLET